MVRKEIKRVIDYLIILLEKRGIKVEKLIVFGSQVKRDFNKDSDIDVVVISKDFSHKGIFKKAEMLKGIDWELVEKFMVPLDIITMSPEEFEKGISLVSQFARSGEVIYS